MMSRIALGALICLPLLAHAGGVAKLAGVDDRGRPFSASVEFAGGQCTRFVAPGP